MLGRHIMNKISGHQKERRLLFLMSFGSFWYICFPLRNHTPWVGTGATEGTGVARGVGADVDAGVGATVGIGVAVGEDVGDGVTVGVGEGVALGVGVATGGTTIVIPRGTKCISSRSVPVSGRIFFTMISFPKNPLILSPSFWKSLVASLWLRLRRWPRIYTLCRRSSRAPDRKNSP